ncbi:hypothetical protein [Streptomyces sp. NPDC000994]
MSTAAALATVVAAGVPLAIRACRRDPGPLARRTPQDRRARARAQDDRDLLRIARNDARKERQERQ